MYLERIVSEGLAHASYFVADGGQAVVIDPRRDVDVYLELARRQRSRILAVCETHRNEDYVVGSTALAAATGADILHSSRLPFGYGSGVTEGDALAFGRLRLRVIETPGHTDESLSFALSDTAASDDPFAVFTGDALFVGDTGRTDLYGAEEAQRVARSLPAGLFDKILPLGDGVLLFPAHGAGSVCGGAISHRDASSLGFERLHGEHLLRDRDAFVRAKLAERHLVPPYFRRMEEWNQRGSAPIHERVPWLSPLSAGELAERAEGGAVVVDARMPQAFAGGHVPGSYNVWLEGLSSYLGWVVPPGRELLLVLPEEASIEHVTRVLLRIGYDEIGGYLRGGFESWQDAGRPIGRLGTLDTGAVERMVGRGEATILDVRKPSEWEDRAFPDALRIFVGELEARISEVPTDRAVVSTCSVGHRGGLAASILARHSVPRVYNYLGGTTAWKARRSGRAE
jgi:hydroxyacylglutathione hydrolase